MKNDEPKVTVLAEVPEAIDVLTVSVLRFTLASKPSSVTLIFCAGSFDSNSQLNLNPLTLYYPLEKVLN